MQSSTSRLQTFLRMLETFFDKPRKKKSRRKLNRVKKEKKKKKYHIDCKIVCKFNSLWLEFTMTTYIYIGQQNN